ncbi:hypothetical protein Vadar_001381 [Vaccinium darrowii]|uniref:Uncharacterized protein n=1 Tax=Vaccinium darrowii TaxID=229202 RepID=A0ACB7Z9W1_9ERIC|nr:hypothetical protein Vadar_001381 [Vaccinium darrowii]
MQAKGDDGEQLPAAKALEMGNEIIKRKWVPTFAAMEGLVNGFVKMPKVHEAKKVVVKMKTRLRGVAVDSWGKIQSALPLYD